jgi:AbrB family looped-hinge helix DNA binding protein
VRITAKGQVTIPVAIRNRLGLQPGTPVVLSVDGDSVRITKVRDQEPLGRSLIAGMRGSVESPFSTDDIMALTRE